MAEEETDEYSFNMYYHILLWIVICFFWWRWRSGENLSDINTEGKYIFITGCDSGFGKMAALTFDRRGFLVFAGCLTEKGAKNLREESSDNLQTVMLDVTNTESVKQAAELVEGVVGENGLWGLINNAGIMGASAPTDWLTIEHFRAPIEVNLIGLINVTLHMLPMVKVARGRIVNITSVGGVLTICSGGYCPSKYGAEAFTNSLRHDMKPFGVKVSCIQPGLFKTSLSDKVRVIKEKIAIWNSLPPKIQHQYGENYLKEDSVKKERIVRLCQNSDLSRVVRCMEHAIMSSKPKTHYSAGTDAKIIWMPLSKMPVFVQDFVIMKNKVNLVNPHAE